MQNVFIINFKSLYEILDEIKENLSFKIIKIENEEDLEKKLDLNRLDYLVISKTNKKSLENINITDKNFLIFNDFPLSSSKLLELINIKLIKLKFNQQSKIIIKGYQLNLNSKFFSKGNLKLKLTEKEIEILACWLNFNLINLILISSNNFLKDKGKLLKPKKFLSVMLIFSNNL